MFVHGPIYMSESGQQQTSLGIDVNFLTGRLGPATNTVQTSEAGNVEKRGGAHMPGFTPARTRYQLVGKLAMKPRTMPICIMNQ
jgi:hypothetical protein